MRRGAARRQVCALLHGGRGGRREAGPAGRRAAPRTCVLLILLLGKYCAYSKLRLGSQMSSIRRQSKMIKDDGEKTIDEDIKFMRYDRYLEVQQ